MLTSPALHRGLIYRTGPIAGLLSLWLAGSVVVLAPWGLWRVEIVAPLVLVGLALAWRGSGILLPEEGPVLVPSHEAGGREVVRDPAWAAWGLVGLGVLTALWSALTHSEHVVLRRDAGSYAQYAYWLAAHYSLPIPGDLGSFGGPAALAVPGFTLASPAFFQESVLGHTVLVPQFLPGAPAWYSLGFWLAGWTGLLLVPSVLGGLGVVAMGGLAARFVGPRWALAPAAAFAVAFPVLHSTRTTFSEPAAVLVITTVAAAFARATSARDPGAARVAGLALGLGLLVRIDALTELCLSIPVVALAARGGFPARAYYRALALGASVGAGGALVISLPYVASLEGSLLPLLALLVVLVVATIAWHRWGTPTFALRLSARIGPATLARGAAWALVGLGVLLASRPLWTTAHQSASDPGAIYVARLQAAQGLAVEAGRTYAESSLTWVSWWIGPLALTLGWLGFAGLARGAVRWLGRPAYADGTATAPIWFVPGLIGLGSTLLTLYRPGITPDHPWADRRLVVVLLPTVLLAATVLIAHLVAEQRARYGRRRATSLAVGAVLVLVGPALWVSGPLSGVRTEVGEPGAVAAVCAALRPGEVVLAVDDRARNEWPQVIRGVCGHPAGSVRVLPDTKLPDARAIAAVVALVHAQGRQVVLLTAGDPPSGRAALEGLGVTAVEAVSLTTHEDQRLLTRTPWRGQSLAIEVWLGRYPSR